MSNINDAMLADVLALLNIFANKYFDDECWYDHHGYCQAHLLEMKEDCSVMKARKLLKELVLAK